MKKIFAVVICAAFALSLIGCGGGSRGDRYTYETPSAAVEANNENSLTAHQITVTGYVTQLLEDEDGTLLTLNDAADEKDTKQVTCFFDGEHPSVSEGEQITVKGKAMTYSTDTTVSLEDCKLQ